MCQTTDVTNKQAQAMKDFANNEYIQQGINSATHHALMHIQNTPKPSAELLQLCQLIQTVMQHARAFEQRSEKLAAIRLLTQDRQHDQTKRTTMIKDFVSERELNFSLHPEANRDCQRVSQKLKEIAAQQPLPAPLTQLHELIITQSTHCKAAKESPERGSQHLWIPSVFRKVAEKITRDQDICLAILGQRSPAQASTKRYRYRHVIYTFEALRSGSGEIPCFKVTTDLGEGEVSMLMKMHQFENITTIRQSKAKAQSAVQRQYFASDLLYIESEDKSVIQGIELQEWLQGSELSKIPQTDPIDTWKLIKKMVQYIADNHALQRTMLDFTLDNVWLEDASKAIIVADKKSLYDLTAIEDEAHADANPTIQEPHYPYHTPCYLLPSTTFKKQAGQFSIQPYNICNQSLAHGIAYLVASLHKNDHQQRPVLPGPQYNHPLATIALIFEEAMARTPDNEIMLLELRHCYRMLVDTSSNRYTASLVLKHMKALPYDVALQAEEGADAEKDTMEEKTVYALLSPTQVSMTMWHKKAAALNPPSAPPRLKFTP